MDKKKNVLLMLFGGSFIVICITIGQILEPILYIFIPMGVVAIGIMTYSIIKGNKRI